MLPELNFLEVDIDRLTADCQKLVEAELGRKLKRADPILLMLKSMLAIIAQQRVIVNQLAKENLLAYARKLTLDKIGELVGCSRLGASAAGCTVEVRLSAPREKTLTILQGTRVTAGDNVNFALDEEVIFLAGEVAKTVHATCTEAGELGNGYKVGELSKIVDPQAFLESITNLTVTEGGADIESDDSYRERIRITPETFSVAGPVKAYETFTKAVSSLIVDVAAESLRPGEVDIYALLEGGELPGEEMREQISAYLNDKTRRPLTDKVLVHQPEVVTYDIDLIYYIDKSTSNIGLVQVKVEQAIADYILWQKSKLGRDINPTELYYRIRAAGAKRAQIISPTFTATNSRTVALAGDISIRYGGAEEE